MGTGYFVENVTEEGQHYYSAVPPYHFELYFVLLWSTSAGTAIALRFVLSYEKS